MSVHPYRGADTASFMSLPPGLAHFGSVSAIQANPPP